ncbi:MAG: biosynthetic arginine decarboxylase, partial [Thermoanaerobaculia bacterium]
MSSSAAVSRSPKAPKPSRVRVPEKFADAEKLYGIENWGKGFFSVSDDGNLLVHPPRENHRFVDLKGVIDDVALRGISTPVVVRFPQILDATVKELNEAFLHAIKEYEYDGVFRGVFPIKVNQKKIVVKEIIESGRKYGYGLEAGSKPELLAALSQDLGPDCLITTNGYKDEAFIKLALNGLRMGKTP